MTGEDWPIVIAFLSISFLIDWYNFKQFGKSPVSNDRSIMVDNGSDISFFISLSIITGMLSGPTALFRLKVFRTSSISSAVVGGKKNVFCIFLSRKS